MDFITLFFTALALSADAVAVSIAAGLTCTGKKEIYNSSARAAIAFGVFQGLMTFIGWAIGSTFEQFITNFDHWVAFILLTIIGIKMIKEAFGDDDDKTLSLCNLKAVLILAVATSIDALAVGISFAMLTMNLSSITIATFTIGIVTLVLSGLGVLFGSKLKQSSKFGTKINVAGGVILILIGLKILIEHLFV